MNFRNDDRLPRREFLRLGTAAASLGVVPGFRPPKAFGNESDDTQNCICIFNTGGMSHLDLWDPKPDAPSEIRGEFAPIETSVPGAFFSELLPRTARVADKLAIVRCMSHREFNHAEAWRQAMRNAPLPVQVFPAVHQWLETGNLQTRMSRACAMIEVGCRFVSIENGHWDTHSRNAWCLKSILAPAFDQAFSALIADLSDRGLLESTLVVVATEFGRSPRINRREGRDHWPHAFSIVLAGGGIEGGQVIGRTDRHGAYVADRM
jgi:uncharacterized protein (DUF1501 family)